MGRLDKTIIEQRCKVVTAPLAHRVAMSTNEGNVYSLMDDERLDAGIIEVIKNLNNIKMVELADTVPSEFPLTEASLKLRRNVAFCAAVTTVELLANSKFVKEVFRDGSQGGIPFFSIFFCQLFFTCLLLLP
jgi:hypothetical protein